MNKKITIIAKYFHPVSTGMEINMLETYSGFVNRGWKVTVFTSRDTHLKRNVLKTREEIKGIKVHRLNSYIFNLMPWWLNKNIWSSGLLCFHGFDIFPDYFILIALYLTKKLHFKKPKVVLTPHGIFDLTLGDSKRAKFIIKSGIDSTIGVWLINHIVDKIRTVSEWEKRSLAAKGINIDNIFVQRNGLEKEAFGEVEKNVPAELKRIVKGWGKYVIQIARIDPIKNQEAAIRALSRSRSDMKLILVGPDYDLEYRQKLENLIRELNLENSVVFYGKASGFEKYYLIKKSILMVHMAKLEGFCNAVHEAMSQGIPCLVSRGTALEELVKEKVNGYLADPNDEVSIAKVLQRVVQNRKSAELKKITKNNKEVTANKSWARVSFKLEKPYRDLLKYPFTMNYEN